MQTARLNYWRMAPLLVIALIALVGYFALADIITFESISDNRVALIAFRDQHYFLASLAFILAYVAMVAFSLPGAAVASVTCGFLFGLFPGVVYVVVAATAGATLIFSAARMGVGDYLSARMDTSGEKVQQFKEGLRENEISYLLLIRLVPVVPFFAANLLPALVGARTRIFVLTTFFGIMPGSAVFTYIGVGLGELLDRGETPHLGIIFDWYILGPILALCALAAFPIVIRRIRSVRSRSHG